MCRRGPRLQIWQLYFRKGPNQFDGERPSEKNFVSSPTKTKTGTFDPARYQGLSRDTLVRIYRTMFLSRRLDDREIQLKRQDRKSVV